MFLLNLKQYKMLFSQSSQNYLWVIQIFFINRIISCFYAQSLSLGVYIFNDIYYFYFKSINSYLVHIIYLKDYLYIGYKPNNLLIPDIIYI